MVAFRHNVRHGSKFRRRFSATTKTAEKTRGRQAVARIVKSV